MRIVLFYCILFAALLPGLPAQGQFLRNHEAGRPFQLRNFSKGDLPNQQQNWSITQDARGIMYFANNLGVFEFDGAKWRLIPISNQTSIFSVKAARDGKIFVGARNDFGVLLPDSTSTLQYHSLLAHVKPEERIFNAVWSVHETTDGIYFHTHKYIFKWDGEHITSWSSTERFHTAFSVNDRLYVRREGMGLLEMVGDSLRLIGGGDMFANNRIFALMPVDSERIMIGSQINLSEPPLLHIYDGDALKQLSYDEHLKEKRGAGTFYHGAALANNTFALATLWDGVFIVNEEGALVEALGGDRDVPEDVNYVFSDRQGGLWIAHNSSGISYVGDPVQLQNLFGDDGLSAGSMVYDSGPNAVIRHNGAMYVATDQGLSRLKARVRSNYSRLEEVDFDLKTFASWSLASVKEELLVAGEYGLYSVNGTTGSRIAFDETLQPRALLESQANPGRIYVGMETGLGYVTKTAEGWREKLLPEITDSRVTALAERADGSLWFVTDMPRDLWRVDFDEDGNVKQKELLTAHLNLEGRKFVVGNIDNEIAIIAPPLGVYRPASDAAQSKDFFVLDERLAPNNVEGDSLRSVKISSATQAWYFYDSHVEILDKISEDEFSRISPKVLKMPPWNGVKDVYVEDDGVAWISSGTDLLRYDPAKSSTINLDQDPELLIRNVSILWTESVLYGGSNTPGEPVNIKLEHDENDLQFDFALLEYGRLGQVQYQYKLKGFDENWSPWLAAGTAYYRDIAPGGFEFDVRARIGNKVLPKTASISVFIDPPWFLTWWMKGLYMLFLIVSVVHLVRYQRTKKEVLELEKERKLNERLNHANEQLRVANESLEQTNRMKDEFLANASHELRTPLTAILGFTSVLKEEVSVENQEFLGLIDENGKRLLQTINSLLDLAKLRAGMLELNLRTVDIGSKAGEVVELLNQLAKNKNLFLHFAKPEDKVEALLDEHFLERILYNLIGNAIKFTVKGGIVVAIEQKAGKAFIHVKDTGIGIGESFLPFLFDEFKQEPMENLSPEGSGLGLTITSQLVELLEGQISVVSKKGEGSTFTVAFEVINGDIEGHSDRNAVAGSNLEREPSSSLQ